MNHEIHFLWFFPDLLSLLEKTHLCDKTKEVLDADPTTHLVYFLKNWNSSKSFSHSGHPCDDSNYKYSVTKGVTDQWHGFMFFQMVYVSTKCICNIRCK